jgi:DNA mismatch repair protein MutL
VVENPASCVRELVENALDEGASEVEIEVTSAGKRTIRVRDNGCGMGRDEILLAVERYTTRKIETPEDLESITTLGFRGEALYAIASVSKLTLTSRPEGSEEGWEARFEAGERVSLEPAAHPKGTTVTVEDLFFNVPARRKFLKGDLKETRSVIETVTSYALAHPGVGFVLSVEGETVINARPVPSIRERIADLYGGDFLEEMVGVERRFGDSLWVSGFISAPEKLKGRATVQSIFVNGRRVEDRALRMAVYRAYGVKGAYPQFLLFLQVAPSAVDFNVHPQKREVKLSGTLNAVGRVQGAARDVLKPRDRAELRVTGSRSPSFHPVNELPSRQMEFGELKLRTPDEGEERDEYVPTALWQIHGSYIVAQVRSGIIIVDQHAAHERVIYERLKSRKFGSQSLLFPIVIHLRASIHKVFLENQSILESLGFQFRTMSGRSIVVEAVPDIFENPSKEKFFEILEEIEESKALPDRLHNVLKAVSCKAAVKFGNPLSTEEMNALVDQLFACETQYFCPHGRPTVFRMTLEELARKFGR